MKIYHCKCGSTIAYSSGEPICSDCNRGHYETKPIWVLLVSYLRTPKDTGVGDTVQRYAAMLGGEQFKVWAKKLGMPCGCTTRQKEWNLRYPYSEPHDQQQSSPH